MNTKRTTIYLPPEIEQAMKQLASEHSRSLNGEIIQACKAWIEYANRPDVQYWESPTMHGQRRIMRSDNDNPER